MYLAWTLFCEGNGDYSHFEILLPRLMEDVARTEGSRPTEISPTPAVSLGRGGRSPDAVAKEVCGRARDAIHLLFVHADTGGRSQEIGLEPRSTAYCEAIRARCDWPPARYILLTPRHATEAWALADPAAVGEALGFTGPPGDIGLPPDADAAERLPDLKAVLRQAARLAGGRRSGWPGAGLFVSIAQSQSITCLRTAPSFQDFERRLRMGLIDLGCLKSTA